MILFTVVAVILLLLMALLVITVGIGGGVFVILFADVIVAFGIIGWIISRKKKKK